MSGDEQSRKTGQDRRQFLKAGAATFGCRRRRRVAADPQALPSLSHPVSTVIIGCDSVPQLEENLALARSFTPLSGAQMIVLEAKTASVASQALFFRHYDRA